MLETSPNSFVVLISYVRRSSVSRDSATEIFQGKHVSLCKANTIEHIGLVKVEGFPSKVNFYRFVDADSDTAPQH